MSTVYIYVLKHPVTQEVRYVGLTRFRVKRLNNEINYPHTKHLKNWIESLKTAGLKPLMEVVEESQEGPACEAEIRWIAEMRSRGCRLINFTDGGERGYQCTDEYRASMSAWQKGKKKKPHSLEHCAAISRAHLGKKKPWAAKNAAIATKACIGRKMPEEAKKHLSDLQKKVMVGERLRKLTEGNKRRIRPSKVTNEQKSEIKKLILDGYSHKVIAEAYGLAIGTVSCIKRNKMWVSIEPATHVANPPVHKKIPLIRNQSGQYERKAA